MMTYSQKDRYGRLSPLAVFEQPGKSYIRLLCVCDCGTVKSFYKDNLVRGFTTSCGCVRLAMNPHNLTLGRSKNNPVYSTYRAWTAMKQRCLNPLDANYADYGGRGIKVCKRWLTFENFFQDMGYRPQGRRGRNVEFSIDRKNNDGNYEPRNCRWATWEQQAANRRIHAKTDSH